ncbi:hypothetical protein [Thermoproteus tenax]|uniref:Uncharacterized protein n=1 Tax=Thermoproteus tenax (strain ATCC 35583 / DSM 2078 / JCM 9277 / NBRC 100435 / Kra 1) TaxID=768679 RepID=G4RJS7_THETK|nr:hypothetical protein [Thermoproteus tenax]CCC81822.1 hypothetical protein TTX_1182 [Thermoproteus tenax Kra 1]
MLGLVRYFWLDLLPPLPEGWRPVLRRYVELWPRALTPYAVAKEVDLTTSAVYRSVYALARNRLILPAGRDYRATVKGAIALLVEEEDPRWLKAVRKIWGIGLDDITTAFYLVALGAAIRRLGFTIREAYICNWAASQAYIATQLDSLRLPPAVEEAVRPLLRYPSETALECNGIQPNRLGRNLADQAKIAEDSA